MIGKRARFMYHHLHVTQHQPEELYPAVRGKACPLFARVCPEPVLAILLLSHRMRKTQYKRPAAVAHFCNCRATTRTSTRAWTACRNGPPRIAHSWGAKKLHLSPFAPLHTKIDHFTKTGSGQTYRRESTQQRECLFRRQDCVLWHSFGTQHIPRLEDWPVMPVESTGFTLKPDGFFRRSPAMDVAAACRL